MYPRIPILCQNLVMFSRFYLRHVLYSVAYILREVNSANIFIVIARASDKIVEDFEGAQECIKLLHTVHSDVIEAIITNTIAYRWATDPEFRKLTYPRDNLSGIYLVCFSTEGREGEYLTSLENERLEDNMES